MDKLNFVREGGSKLPLGFRFQPTDKEIVFQYLAGKIFRHPLPADVIPEINIFSFDPWELPGDSDQDKYFFSNPESGYRNGNTKGRATCSGYWKAAGSAKRIISSKGSPVVGIRNSLVFYMGKNRRPFRTNWIMHEYCIALPGNTYHWNSQKKMNSQGSLIRIGNWTLCHVFFKKRSSTAQVDHDYDNPWSYGSMAADTSDTDSSSASSSSPCCDPTVVAEVTSTSADCSESSRKNI